MYCLYISFDRLRRYNKTRSGIPVAWLTILCWYLPNTNLHQSAGWLKLGVDLYTYMPFETPVTQRWRNGYASGLENTMWETSPADLITTWMHLVIECMNNLPSLALFIRRLSSIYSCTAMLNYFSIKTCTYIILNLNNITISSRLN
jgi:hypothetical protein